MLGVLKIIFYICISELTISLERPFKRRISSQQRQQNVVFT